MRSNARVFPCGRPAWVRARLDARLPCARSPHCAGVTSLVRIRSTRRRPPPCAARDREEAPDGRGASGIETRGRASGRARRSPGRAARATPPPSRTRGRRAAGSVQTPPRGPPGHTPTRGSTRSTRGQVRRRARRRAGAAAGPRAPAPAATSALCARARALRPGAAMPAARDPSRPRRKRDERRVLS